MFDFLVYIAPNEKAGIPRGVFRRIVGDKVVQKLNELPGAKIPLARIIDGSSDNEMYPRPVMATWIPDQLTVNALVSKLVEHVRIFGTGRIMAQKGAMITETYTNIVGSLLEYMGQPPQLLRGPLSGGPFSCLYLVKWNAHGLHFQSHHGIDSSV